MRFSTATSPISQGNVNGVGAIIFSLFFIATGLWVLYLAGVIPLNPYDVYQDVSWWMIHPPKSSVPRWVLASVGGIFFLGGLSVLISGSINVLHNLNNAHLKKRAPNSPWLWDYNWKRGKNLTRPKTPWWSHLIGISILIGFHAVAWGIAYEEKFKGMIIIFPAGITVFTFLIAIIFGVIHRRAKAHQHVSIQLESFPLRLGSTFKIYIRGLKKSSLPKVQSKVVAVEEYYSNAKNNAGAHCRVKYEWEEDFNVTSDLHTLEIPLPGEINISTKLSERPAVFWELHLYSSCDGPDLDKRFLLPIY